MEFQHKSVLLQECIDALNIRPDGIYLDGTLGGAGHSSQIARRLTEGGRLIGVDRDRTALAAAKERLAPYADRVTLVHSNFAEIDAILDSLGIPAVDGMLFDLGVSSPQLDDASRGFSYMADAPLDMRMDKDDALTAGEVVNSWPQGELRRILYDYGEERYAPQIAAAICRAREKAPVETTLELVDIIRSAMPAQALREKQHPAKRSFQAIRIAVNDELGAVSRMMQAAVGRLNPGGRLAVITFHSLEDRIVKSEMQQARHVRARLGISPLTALGAAAAVLMLALVVFSYIRLYEARSDVGKLQTQLSTLEEQQARLQSQYDNALDLEQIEKRAKELGMRQPGSSQIIYVQVDADDTTEVYAAPAEKNVFVRVIDAFRSAFTDAINYFS